MGGSLPQFEKWARPIYRTDGFLLILGKRCSSSCSPAINAEDDDDGKAGSGQLRMPRGEAAARQMRGLRYTQGHR
jgi:hypothetical protein